VGQLFSFLMVFSAAASKKKGFGVFNSCRRLIR
jgi:hypothetical protein